MKTTYNNISLVILAGGLGSRYNGQKQIDPVGPYLESLMEYAIYDAFLVGINHFVFVINQQFEDKTRKYFKRLIELKGGIVEFILQTTYSSVPRNFFDAIIDRKKPWGTGHALLVTKSHLQNPFIVINADDYYGREAFNNAINFTKDNLITANEYATVTFPLSKTLSENGSVSRGICKIENNLLVNVEERTNIFRYKDKILFEEDEITGFIDENAQVSMNFWILHPSIFRTLEDKFEIFMKNYAKDLKAEFYLPQVINELIHEKKIEVLVRHSSEQWFGMTYPLDKPLVKEEILNKIDNGIYPKKLWN